MATVLPTPPGFNADQGFVNGDAASSYEPWAGDQMGAADPANPPPTQVSIFGPGLSQMVPSTTPAPSPAPRTVGIAFAAFGLSPLLGGSLLALLQCGEEDSAEDLSAVPDADIDTALPDLQVGDEARPPTLFEKGAINNFFKKLRNAFTGPSSTAIATVAGTAQAPIVVQIPDKSDHYEVRDYLDQAAGRGSFTLLSPTELRELRERYVKVTGASPTGECRPSNEQLSALGFRLRRQPDGTLKAPFTEFAVFGPYDSRSVKLRQFHAHVLTREGSWQNQLLRGPASFSSWLACLNVYECGMVMLGAALPGQLRLYREGIERLDKLFPRLWGNIAKLDETMRAERWGRLHQEILDGTVATPFGFNPDCPWGTIIA